MILSDTQHCNSFIHIHISILFGVFSHIDYHRTLVEFPNLYDLIHHSFVMKFEQEFFFFFSFLGLHLWHMDVPKLGVELELQLPAFTTATATWDLSCICDLHHSSQLCWILNPLSEARDQTQILMDTSWIVSAVPQRELRNL